MGKKVREIITLLEMNGWHFLREKGDHKIYGKQGARRSVSVPGKMSQDLDNRLYHQILRQADINW